MSSSPRACVSTLKQINRLDNSPTSSFDDQDCVVFDDDTYFPTPLRLVGIEPNPGPNHKTKPQQQSQIVKDLVQAVTGKSPSIGRLKKPPSKSPVNKNINSSQMVTTNTLGSLTVSSRTQGMTSKPVIISKSEYIPDIGAASSTSGGFGINLLDIQPANLKVFPWLNLEIKDRFESYTFKKLRFRFEPSVSSLTAGKVGCNFDYDPNELSIFSTNISRTDILNSSNTIVSNISNSVVLDVDPKYFLNKRYLIKSASSASGISNSVYSVGRLIVFSYGVETAGLTIGDWFVDYTIELNNPVQSGSIVLPYNNTIDGFYANNVSTIVPAVNTGAWNNVNWYRGTSYGYTDSLPAPRSSNLFDLTAPIGDNWGDTFFVPPGVYTVNFSIYLNNTGSYITDYSIRVNLGPSFYFIEEHLGGSASGGLTTYSLVADSSLTRSFTVKEATTMTCSYSVKYTGGTQYMTAYFSVIRA